MKEFEMTEKLYYQDAYIKEFTAKVVSSQKTEEGFDVVLDKTAFFPEEGGQYSDTGTLGDAFVKRVYEKDGIIHHISDSELNEGECVIGKINFEERYEKMQCHTGEHILSGIFHSLYGLENVGFHLGKDEVTMDINAVLTEEQIVKAEEMANIVIYENVPVLTSFPTAEELEELEYRSKLELREKVRIVTIGKYDACACCAPHVKMSGEVGIVRILDYMKHRGGTRITMTAGIRALRDYRERYETIRAVSGLLSVPKSEISEGVKKILSDMEDFKLKYKKAREELFLMYAESVPETEGNIVLHYSEAGVDELRVVANTVIDRVGGILVLLSGNDGDFKHLTVSKSVNLRELCPGINKALCGRGGGKPEAIQGSFGATLDNIKKYFGV